MKSYTLNAATAAKIRTAKKSSKFYLNQRDEENKFYTSIIVEDGTRLNIPFKAAFFKNPSEKLNGIVALSNSAINCSSHAAGMCQLHDPERDCFGLRIETQYTRQDIINSQESNFISGLILQTANTEKLAEYINTVLKPDYIRFNKHGDFINDTQFLNLMHLVERCRDIKFFGYTARDDIMKQYNITGEYLTACHPNLRINGSNHKYNNRFKVTYNYKEWIINYIDSCSGQCNKCFKCINRNNTTIYALFHHSNAETILNTAENRQFLTEVMEAVGITDINPDELQGGNLFNNLNKAYQYYYNTDLKKTGCNSTKDFISDIIRDLQNLQNSGVLINKKYFKNLGVL